MRASKAQNSILYSLCAFLMYRRFAVLARLPPLATAEASAASAAPVAAAAAPLTSGGKIIGQPRFGVGDDSPETRYVTKGIVSCRTRWPQNAPSLALFVLIKDGLTHCVCLIDKNSLGSGLVGCLPARKVTVCGVGGREAV